MRLLDRLSAYSFNLYYLKGKDMILADYLSRNRNDDEDPAELIPVSFCKIETLINFVWPLGLWLKLVEKQFLKSWGGQRIRPTHYPKAAIC